MKISSKTRLKKGFTLVEMIGVLAIIAVLAVVIAPKVFGAIRSSRINGTMLSIDTFKTITTDFVGKYGTLPVTNNNSRIDDLLIEAGLSDERFAAKIGLQSDVYAVKGATWKRGTNGAWTASGGSNQSSTSRIICKPSNTTAPNTAGGSNFKLDGSKNMPSGARVISTFLESVPEAEARELSERIDGDALSTTSGADAKGKVVYNTPSRGITDVYVYMMHQ
ncbi:prepilin-type N-terminal cleavage/methylation domain-containing protein [Pelagicoccus sp. SDUM812002]|uniref:type II secretion system protein n=1 Tax=Pelagicoccus sp. SDUM812002 TaxID=3041266 RepID=UPI002810902A|nr:prepilin-type N-terminal cleavage/methylation domain-containing protein [Pelagicoccus sp. SDUM812002]MDQ8186478.1 prepilin-type N-terminal cleavage/methylation domain-containing protein [Pelagicoccus sp. SDUM812002]